MPKQPFIGQSLLLQLESSSSVPLYKQIDGAIRDAILSGRLRSGTHLPATRVLAQELGVSRSTVLTAFDQLLAEGYLLGRVGDGTYVATELPDHLLPARTPGKGRKDPASLTPRLSRLAATVTSTRINLLKDAGAPRAFWPALPSLDGFPFKLWAQLASRRLRHPAPDLFAYDDPAGYGPLREALADYLKAVRAVRCNVDQVFIVAGSQQAMDLSARLLLDSEDAVWIEDPCYPPARGILLCTGARLVPVPVDREGLVVAAAVKRCPNAKMAFVTPSHQYPLGPTMSLTRRLELLSWANQAGAWVLENDYNSFHRYQGPPLAALQGLDTSDRVIYAGTFSNVLFPSLRLGYLIVPPNLVEITRAARTLVDRHSPSLEQAILTDFIVEGHFSRHIRRMRVLYAERQEILVAAVKKEMGGLLTVPSAEAGLHLVGWLPSGINATTATLLAAEVGVRVQPLSAYSIESTAHNGVMLGYAALRRSDIELGVQRLASAWNRLN